MTKSKTQVPENAPQTSEVLNILKCQIYPENFGIYDLCTKL